MPIGEGLGAGTVAEGGFLAELARFIGTTVTIYTTSGGQSGFGITGVLTNVNPSFIRLITCIGPAPCCCLGSACTGGRIGPGTGGARGFGAGRFGAGFGGFGGLGGFDGFGNAGGFGFVNNVGSVTEIPVDRIAAYVHNAV